MLRFDEQIRANRYRLFGFLLVYLLTATAVGYLVALFLEAFVDPVSYDTRVLYEINFPWDTRQIDGLPRPFFFNWVFWLTLAFLGAALAYYRHLVRNGGSAILRLVDARPLREHQFANTLGEIAVAAGVEAPRLFIVESPAVNAFACRDGDGREVIAVTRGLLDTMDRDQIQAVVAHEMAHLRNGDTKLMTLFAGVSRMMDLVRWVGMTGVQMMIWLARQSRVDDPPTASLPAEESPEHRPVGDPFADEQIVRGWRNLLERQSSLVLLALTLFVVAVFAGFAFAIGALLYAILFSASWKVVWLFLILPTGLFFLRLAVSRNREFQADATAVRLTRNPRGLRSALEHMRDGERRGGIPGSVAPLLIAPLHSGRRLTALSAFEEELYRDGVILTPDLRAATWRSVRRQWIGKRLVAGAALIVLGGVPLRLALAVVRGAVRLFGTHPPLGERIERLAAMSG